MSTEKTTPDYKLRYDKKRERIAVSFNLEDENEAAMYEYGKTIVFSTWVKELMHKEMKKLKLLPNAKK